MNMGPYNDPTALSYVTKKVKHYKALVSVT